jgi:hypothetical protein
LADLGWTVLRIWEHEPGEHAADRVIRIHQARRAERLGVRDEG